MEHFLGKPRLYWVEQPFDGRLAVSSRPEGWELLDETAQGWRDAGIDVIVSMLEREEAEALGLEQQQSVCRSVGLEYINCPVPDHGTPQSVDALQDAVDRALAHLARGHRVAAHCFAGIGRSPLFVASVIVRHGIDPDTAWQSLIAARGIRLPDTTEQKRWVAEFARIGPRPVARP